MQDFIVVYVTAGSTEEGERLAQALIDERLAACVNRVSGVRSVYRWEGKLEQSAEELLIIKTRKELFDRLQKRVRELHSYTVPEVIALPIVQGSDDYLRWLDEQLPVDPRQRVGNLRTVKEVSAGGVMVRRRGDLIETALIHVRHRWGLPKGHVEKGETADRTALREVREETGLDGKVVQKLGEIRYSYRDKSKKGEPVRIYKRVHFYLLNYLKGDVQNHDHEVDEARWFPIEEAIKSLKFATERKMVQRAMNILTAPTRALAASPSGKDSQD